MATRRGRTPDLILEGAFDPGAAALIDGSPSRIDVPRLGGRERRPGFDWRPTVAMVVFATVGALAYLWLI